ncbi:UDP-2,4-diacetamido-2,4,6-trideoxy-beta-L-altropyranose hydrolase [Vreelandella zhanjiangensis]|uniref:UDP-2,4-diacetamido-2,4, 6-trideoxy-beta-L-altropyranose hydrolase n=1 Tax=Vreelandella zhanjiangensis TaxID=1121960 RepID=UPI00402A6EC0
MGIETNRAVRIAFRVDASLQIGTGHVMRCLTLAKALRETDAECHFLCREHQGNLIDSIEQQGFTVQRLAASTAAKEHRILQDNSEPFHAPWLGVSWQEDSDVCRSYLAELSPDWLIVDHYALDEKWEAEACPLNARLLVIDDLADRPHCANVLLDQNLVHSVHDYTNLVPEYCKRLVGTEFALLRPEFASLREVSLAKRQGQQDIQKILVCLGGVDKDNATGLVLKALHECALPPTLEIDVVMGAAAPWLAEVQQTASSLPYLTNVLVNVNNIAQLMTKADLAIGAAGSTSWERCCLGLPSLMVVLAENQREVAEKLDSLGAAKLLGDIDSITSSLPNAIEHLKPDFLKKMSNSASSLVVGNGVEKVMSAIL